MKNFKVMHPFFINTAWVIYNMFMDYRYYGNPHGSNNSGMNYKFSIVLLLLLFSFLYHL